MPTHAPTTTRTLALGLLGCAAGAAFAQATSDEPNLRRSHFGYPVAIAGNTIFIADSTGGPESAGCVHVYQRVDGVWSEMDTIKPETTWPNMGFGWGLAAAGDLLAVGAPGALPRQRGPIPNDGAVFVYRREGTNWRLSDTVQASEEVAHEHFGEFLATDGRFIVTTDNPWVNRAGSPLFSFEFRDAEWVPLPAPSLHSEKHATRVAEPFAVSDGTLLAYRSVFAYEDGKWRTIESADLMNAVLPFVPPALDADTILVPDSFAVLDDNRTGVVHVVTRTDGVWSRTGRIEPPPDLEESAQFGAAVALHADVAVIMSAPKPSTESKTRMHVYERSGSGWSRTAVFGPFDAENEASGIGDPVLRDGVIALRVGVDEATSVLVFEARAGTWQQVARLVAPDAPPQD